ncbi:MAG: phosphate ABC transporter ATP-binding protein PstB [Breznakibacter sp.]
MMTNQFVIDIKETPVMTIPYEGTLPKSNVAKPNDHQPDANAHTPMLVSKALNVYYGDNHVLKDINMEIESNAITAFIGPSGCGKSTYLRLFNRMNDFIDSFRMTGSIAIGGKNIYDKDVETEELRKRVGMVFQKPNPFPKPIYENVAYGLKIQGVKKKSVLDDAVEKALKQAALWDEVKNDLKKSALALSGGQQQRLCIARTLAVEPSVILMDEPTSALDPIASAKIEDLMTELKSRYTIIVVTHNMQQASRVSDYCAFFYLGDLVEYSDTRSMFTHPNKTQTQNYITGRFG